MVKNDDILNRSFDRLINLPESIGSLNNLQILYYYKIIFVGHLSCKLIQVSLPIDYYYKMFVNYSNIDSRRFVN